MTSKIRMKIKIRNFLWARYTSLYLEKQKENRIIQKQTVLCSQSKRAGLARRIAAEKLMLASKSIIEVHFETRNNQFKKDFGMQTDQGVDYILQLDIGKSKIERAKLNSREKSDRDRLAKSKLRSSDMSSIFKEAR